MEDCGSGNPKVTYLNLPCVRKSGISNLIAIEFVRVHRKPVVSLLVDRK